VFSVCFHTEAWHFGFSRFYHHPVVAQQTADSALTYCTAVSCSRLKRTCYIPPIITEINCLINFVFFSSFCRSFLFSSRVYFYWWRKSLYLFL